MRTNLSSVAVAAMCAAFFACGGSTSSNLQGNNNGNNAGDDSGVSTVPVSDAGTAADADADAGPPVDHGMPSSTYPAFMPDFGQIVDNGGYVMKKPVIVAVTWDSDPSQASFDSFADTVGGTSYWQTTTSEYGVGAATSGTMNHVHLSGTPPTQVTDTDLQNMVTSNASATADGGAPAWPAPTQDTIYAFFLPPGTSLQMQTGQGSGTQDACSAGVGGYHDQVTAGTTITSYAVVPSCTFGGGNTAAQQTTMSMSHELIEAVTDPQPQQQNPGYVGFDNDHFAFDWFQEFQSEVGDACELFRSSFYEEKESMPASFDYWVQRTWSNKSGLAGHNPCVPLEAAPYFNVTPLSMEKVDLTFPAYMGQPAQAIKTKGIHIAVGQSATFPVGFYSDAATSGPWTLSFSYGSPLSGQKVTYLTATADKTSGVNGEKANVTVKVNSAGQLGGELLVIKSTLNGESHEMPIVIGSM